ncbi:hypothetical protein [Aestuariivita sp.]|jgi:hypothetical protein|uniref:hypothetical protein n=1 Tax=Aestuariivita sp. TaxID=1872407 RepID=UPI00216CCBB7|nr:hypothetical protein [Aestuariivita sp.]MCE8006867.1 hypothetical protein [Aestuariivita sp.]
MTTRRWPILRALTIGTLQLGFVGAIVGGTVFVSNYMRENQPPRVQIDTDIFVPVVRTETVRLS